MDAPFSLIISVGALVFADVINDVVVVFFGHIRIDVRPLIGAIPHSS